MIWAKLDFFFHAMTTHFHPLIFLLQKAKRGEEVVWKWAFITSSEEEEEAKECAKNTSETAKREKEVEQEGE